MDLKGQLRNFTINEYSERHGTILNLAREQVSFPKHFHRISVVDTSGIFSIIGKGPVATVTMINKQINLIGHGASSISVNCHIYYSGVNGMFTNYMFFFFL